MLDPCAILSMPIRASGNDKLSFKCMYSHHPKILTTFQISLNVANSEGTASMTVCILDVSRGSTAAAAATAALLQSCLTLCDPTDGSPPGSAVPGTLQARTLEWAISFSMHASEK